MVEFANRPRPKCTVSPLHQHDEHASSHATQAPHAVNTSTSRSLARHAHWYTGPLRETPCTPARHAHQHAVHTSTPCTPARHAHQHATRTSTPRAPARHAHQHDTRTSKPRAPARHAHQHATRTSTSLTGTYLHRPHSQATRSNPISAQHVTQGDQLALVHHAHQRANVHDCTRWRHINFQPRTPRRSQTPSPLRQATLVGRLLETPWLTSAPSAVF